MKLIRLLIVAGALAYAGNLFAGIELPLDTVGDQGMTEHCWAYAASHLLESHGQYKTSISTVLDIEKDLRYWIFYDRFFLRYKLGRQIGAGLNDDTILAEEGFPTEFISAFLKHGHPVLRSSQSSSRAAYEYPKATYKYLPMGGRPPVRGNWGIKSAQLIQALSKIKDDKKADELIRHELDESSVRLTSPTTKWLDQEVPVEKIPELMLGDGLHDLVNDPIVWVFPYNRWTPKNGLHTWLSFFGGRIPVYVATNQEIEQIARASLERGLPVIEMDQHHAWASIGYHGDEYVKADSQPARLFWEKGIGSQRGIMVFKSVVTDLMPKPPLTLMWSEPVMQSIDLGF